MLQTTRNTLFQKTFLPLSNGVPILTRWDSILWKYPVDTSKFEGTSLSFANIPCTKFMWSIIYANDLFLSNTNSRHPLKQNSTAVQTRSSHGGRHATA